MVTDMVVSGMSGICGLKARGGWQMRQNDRTQLELPGGVLLNKIQPVG